MIGMNESDIWSGIQGNILWKYKIFCHNDITLFVLTCKISIIRLLSQNACLRWLKNGELYTKQVWLLLSYWAMKIWTKFYASLQNKSIHKWSMLSIWKETPVIIGKLIIYISVIQGKRLRMSISLHTYISSPTHKFQVILHRQLLSIYMILQVNWTLLLLLRQLLILQSITWIRKW